MSIYEHIAVKNVMWEVLQKGCSGRWHWFQGD